MSGTDADKLAIELSNLFTDRNIPADVQAGALLICLAAIIASAQPAFRDALIRHATASLREISANMDRKPALQ